VTLGIRFLLESLLARQAPLLVFVSAVMVASYFGGLGPGLLATLLSLLAGSAFFIDPHLALLPSEPSDVVRMLIFAVIGALITGLNAAYLRSLSRAARGEAALAASEGLYGSLVRQVREYAILTLDDAGRISSWNAGAESLKGYRAGEVVGQDFSLFFTPEDRAAGRPQRNLAAAREAGSYREEGWRLRKDGSRFWADATLTAIRSPDGIPGGFVKVTRDLSEQRATQERLRAAQRELELQKLAVDEHAIVSIADASGRITYVNDKFVEVSGYTAGELIGQDHRVINSGVHPREFFTDLWRTVTSGRTWHGEITNRRKDGSLYMVSSTIVPFTREEDARPYQYVSVRTDVTDLREAQARAMRANDELQARVEERTRELALAHDQAQTLLQLAVRLEGARSPEDVGRLAAEVLLAPARADSLILWEVRHDEARPVWTHGVPAELRHAFASGVPRGQGMLWEAVGGEEPLFLDDAQGDERPLPRFRQAGFRAAAWLPLGDHFVLACARRATPGWSDDERQLLLAASRALSVALGRAEAAAQLREQNRRLEESVNEAEQFVYVVSHDLRTPLLSLQGMAEILEEANQSGDAADREFALSRIRMNTYRMTALLDDLLALSRVGRVEAERHPVDLGEVARSVVAELEPRVRARGVTVDLPEEWPTVLYPPTEAYQVIANLTSNAVKHAGFPGHSPRVRLRWQPEGSCVRVSVEDNGPGIPAPYREKVFGLFQKLDAKAEGTGVGLAIVKRIVERHGGRAWAGESSLGGACLSVTMPLAPPE